MAVSRVEWECPGCRRKFAVPANQPRPELCPQCRTSGGGAQPVDVSEPEVSFGVYQPTAAPMPQAARPVKRRRYGELQTLSLALKVMAVLLALSTLVHFGATAVATLQLPGTEARLMGVYLCFGILLGGATLSLVLYSFAVLLLVAVDVEYNTRPE